MTFLNVPSKKKKQKAEKSSPFSGVCLMIQSFINTAHYIMLEGRGTTLRAADVWRSSRIHSPC